MADDFSLKSIPMICPSCQKAFPPGAKFCNQCGSALEFDFSRLELTPDPNLDDAPSHLSDQTRVFHLDTEAQWPESQPEPAQQWQDVRNQPPVQTPPVPRFDPETGLPYDTPQQPPVQTPPPMQPPVQTPPPMQQPFEPPMQQPKKSKTGLIVGIVAAVVVVAALAIVLVTTSCFGLFGGDEKTSETSGDVQQTLVDAQAAYDAGSFGEAISLLTAAIDGGAQDAALYTLLGESYEAQNNQRAAADAYADGYRATGDTALKDAAMRLYKQAQNWQAASELDPNDPDVVAALGGTNDTPAPEPDDSPVSSGDASSSEELETPPKEEPEDEQLVQEALEAGDYETAGQLAEDLLEDDPGNADLWMALGNSLLGLGRYEDAANAFGNGYGQTGEGALQDAQIEAFYQYTEALLDGGQDRDAYEVFWKILELDPGQDRATQSIAELEDEHIVHRYEVVHADITWQDARRAAVNAGGYLAAVSDEAEFAQITAQAADAGIHVLWLGAEVDSPDDWFDDDFTWLSGEPFTYAPWLEGEPNFELENEYYLGAYSVNGTWFYNDCPDDVSEYYAGKIGYVIEFETWED